MSDDVWQVGDPAPGTKASVLGALDPLIGTPRRQPVDLTDFLLARITEDEARVRAFADSPQFPRGMVVRKHLRIQLAECDAKRRIVAWHRLIDGLDTEDIPVRGCCNCIASGAEPPYIIARPCMTLRLLALPYAEQPSYDELWRP